MNETLGQPGASTKGPKHLNLVPEKIERQLGPFSLGITMRSRLRACELRGVGPGPGRRGSALITTTTPNPPPVLRRRSPAAGPAASGPPTGAAAVAPEGARPPPPPPLLPRHTGPPPSGPRSLPSLDLARARCPHLLNKRQERNRANAQPEALPSPVPDRHAAHVRTQRARWKRRGLRRRLGPCPGIAPGGPAMPRAPPLLATGDPTRSAPYPPTQRWSPAWCGFWRRDPAAGPCFHLPASPHHTVHGASSPGFVAPAHTPRHTCWLLCFRPGLVAYI